MKLGLGNTSGPLAKALRQKKGGFKQTKNGHKQLFFNFIRARFNTVFKEKLLKSQIVRDHSLRRYFWAK